MLSLLLLASPAHATIVNVLSPQVGPPDEGFHGSVKGGLSLEDGNERQFAVNGAAAARWVTGDHQLLFKSSGERATNFGTLTDEEAFAHARWTWNFAGPWSTYAFLQADHNGFRSIRVRDLAGAGMALRMWRNDWTEAHIGSSIMSVHQVLESGVEDDEPRIHLRNSSYLTVAVVVDERITLSTTTFVQPRLREPSDLRAFEQLDLTLGIVDRLAWTGSLRFEWDARPPTGISQHDLAVRSGFVWSW